jgi:hypothetical protein
MSTLSFGHALLAAGGRIPPSETENLSQRKYMEVQREYLCSNLLLLTGLRSWQNLTWSLCDLINSVTAFLITVNVLIDEELKPQELRGPLVVTLMTAAIALQLALAMLEPCALASVFLWQHIVKRIVKPPLAGAVRIQLYEKFANMFTYVLVRVCRRTYMLIFDILAYAAEEEKIKRAREECVRHLLLNWVNKEKYKVFHKFVAERFGDALAG